MMRSTFEITGPSLKAPGETIIATAFIVARPTPVLVTATHVLNAIEGEFATLILRKQTGDAYRRLPFAIRIRKGDTPVWKSPPGTPGSDVAVIAADLPADTDLDPVPVDLLATDDALRQSGLHPGDRLACLGFPLGVQSNAAGFPVLRSGYVASFPLLPSAAVKTFLFDFNVFEGNSGGPVYAAGPRPLVVGLVSQEDFASHNSNLLMDQRTAAYPLGLAVVVEAPIIRQAIALLPPPQPPGRPPSRR